MPPLFLHPDLRQYTGGTPPLASSGYVAAIFGTKPREAHVRFGILLPKVIFTLLTCPAPVGVNDIWKFNVVDRTWTWVRGNSTWLNTPTPKFGQKGVPDPAQEPGQITAVGWTYDQSADELWFMGGCSFAYCHDLWSFNAASLMWTWHSGTGLNAQVGKYGTLGVPNTNNYPGGRRDSALWINPSTRELWLFGGQGYSSIFSIGKLNDLWYLNISSMMWTWAGGQEFPSSSGSFSAMGVRSSSNLPPSRSASMVWNDPETSVAYIWGGYGYLSTFQCASPTHSFCARPVVAHPCLTSPFYTYSGVARSVEV